MYEGLLTDAECDHLISIVSLHLQISKFQSVEFVNCAFLTFCLRVVVLRLGEIGAEEIGRGR